MIEGQQSLIPDGSSPEIRRVWFEGEWWYAVVDFVSLWTDSNDPGHYWRNLKLRADPELKQFIKVWYARACHQVQCGHPFSLEYFSTASL